MNSIRRYPEQQSQKRLVLSSSSLVIVAVTLVGSYLTLQNYLRFAVEIVPPRLSGLWVSIPAFMWLWQLPKLINLKLKWSIFAPAIAFMSVLFLYASAISLIDGLETGLFSFISYGLWLGLFVWLIGTPFYIGKTLTYVLVLTVSMINALPIIYEAISGEILVKVVTIGDTVRRYGIATNIAILGLYLAVGILVNLSAYVSSAKRTVMSLLYLLIILILSIALLAVNIRGPVIYLLIALFIFLVLRKGILFFLKFTSISVFALFLLLLAFPGLFDSLTSRFGFLLDVLTSQDAGNSIRLQIYAKTLNELLHNPRYILVGNGPGMLSLIADSKGTHTFQTESSLLQSILEVGLIGMLPIFFLYANLAVHFFNSRRHKLLQKNAAIPAALLLVCLQCATHESFKTWEGSLLLVLLTGLSCRLSIEISQTRKINFSRSN